jgi:chromosome segregation ATPase
MDNHGFEQLEDMQEAAERWRAEKRRLNAEIDKLEGALADARNTAGKKRNGVNGAKPKTPDSLAYDNSQEVADQKLIRAKLEWDSERAKLLSQINRLEGAVADAIARASNPLRVTQSVKEQFELELTRVAKEKTELEQAFLRSKTQWEQEKLKMTGEMVKLRRTAQIMGRPVPKEDTPEINPKVRDLENQLKENLANWNTDREGFVAQIHKLEEASRQWETERRQLNEHAGQLQQAFLQAQAKIQSYEAAGRAASATEQQIEELRREKELIQQQVQELQNAREGDRRKLTLEIEQLETQLQRVSDNHDRAGEEVHNQLREAIKQKTDLARELESASKLLEAERSRISTATPNTETISAEVARIEKQLAEIMAIVENPATELSMVIRKNVEKAELDAYLRGILYCVDKK